MWKHCGYLCGLLCASAALAEEMPREYRSARYLGMGDAGVSLAEGHDSIFYNPAGMADVKSLVNEVVILSPQVTVSSNAKSLYTQTKGQKDVFAIVNSVANKPEHVGVQSFTGAVFRRAALGLLQRAEMNVFVGTNAERGVLEADARAKAQAGLYSAFGRGFMNDALLIGTTLKLSHKGDAHINVDALSAESQFKNVKPSSLLSKYVKRGTGFGADLGAIWKMNAEMKPRLGIVLRNVGTTSYTLGAKNPAQSPPADKQQLDVGFSIAPGTKRSASVLSMDFHDLLNVHKESPYKRIHLGARLSFDDVLGFTAGINQGYPTYGGFVNIKIVRIEGGMFSEETEKFPGDRRSKRMYGRISVGWTR